MDEEKEITKHTGDDNVAANASHEEKAPLLHALNIEPSESNTTNIPPRLPFGYSYDAPQPTSLQTTDTKEDECVLAEQPHPDMPEAEAPLRTDNLPPMMPKPRKRRNRCNGGKGRFFHRYGWAVVLLLLIIVGGSTAPLWWGDMPWIHSEEVKPTMAADTHQVVKPLPVDTTPKGLTHEDSVRIQDSVRHARWLYWQRRKRAEESAAETTEQVEGDVTTTPAVSANGENHNAVHTIHTDSTPR